MTGTYERPFQAEEINARSGGIERIGKSRGIREKRKTDRDRDKGELHQSQIS